MYAKTYRFRLKQALIHLCQLVDIGNPVVVPGSLPDGQVNVVTEYFRKALYIFPVDT
jgi:hypothetical protein|tara:strand:+ start:104 stop:274 length:171 start_codon:yes stop_codon:yes gene_type:complete